MVLEIIANTNTYGEKIFNSRKKYKWQTLTLNEFNGYLSLLTYIGLVKASELSDYWSKKLGYNFSFQQKTSRKRELMNMTLCTK